MPTHKRATARMHSHARKQAALVDALENAVASNAVTNLVAALRTAAFDDGYIIATLLAGASSLIRGMPNKAPWQGLLEQMARETAGV